MDTIGRQSAIDMLDRWQKYGLTIRFVTEQEGRRSCRSFHPPGGNALTPTIILLKNENLNFSLRDGNI